MHGIERTRKMQGPPKPDNGIAKIEVRYSDGRVFNFVPDGGGDAFSEDDILGAEKDARQSLGHRRVGRGHRTRHHVE